MFGRWTVSAASYAAEVARWADGVGNLLWASVQDWMCEPWIIQKTGLSVREHQERTVASYCELRRLAPWLPWVPVLQGWRFEDYCRHAEDYEAAGVDLEALPVVGLGSVCRRQATDMAEDMIRHFHARGLKLHGFGFKVDGLERVGRYLASADSLAWSFAARKRRLRMEGCEHAACNNCLRWALLWRGEVLRSVERSERRPEQPGLFDTLESGAA